MTATKQYFQLTIQETVQKALGIASVEVRLDDGKVVIEVDPRDSEAVFWRAIKELLQ